MEPAKPIATYRERFAHLRRDFELYDDRIVVSGTISGNKFETTLPLNRIIADFGVVWFRAKRFFYGIAIFILPATFAVLFDVAGSSAMQFIRIAAGALSVWGLAWTLAYLPKRQMYRFLNDSSFAIVLDFIVAGPDEESAKTFAETVRQAIRDCKTGESDLQSMR